MSVNIKCKYWPFKFLISTVAIVLNSFNFFDLWYPWNQGSRCNHAVQNHVQLEWERYRKLHRFHGWYQAPLSTDLCSAYFSSYFSSQFSVMASSSSIPNTSHLVSIKLDRTNYVMWLAQFSPVLKSNSLLGYVNGTEPYPDQFFCWWKWDSICHGESKISLMAATIPATT